MYIGENRADGFGVEGAHSHFQLSKLSFRSDHRQLRELGEAGDRLEQRIDDLYAMRVISYIRLVGEAEPVGSFYHHIRKV
ncbi:MAG TPA: hypothetical protein PLU70_03860 [Thermotogota bacterium]|nr:hypothetical protein [Thermotogota bacterium]HNY82710.1 hypothetical protein [Thermotogota bacterium]HOD90474.1 hypothetical protein [Thermotogota bacterium]HOF22869.1 hypothetical protein [Thermotogota bacterium]HOH11943.1 hypothetical protein [Thermotogota bacterium]